MPKTKTKLGEQCVTVTFVKNSVLESLTIDWLYTAIFSGDAKIAGHKNEGQEISRKLTGLENVR